MKELKKKTYLLTLILVLSFTLFSCQTYDNNSASNVEQNQETGKETVTNRDGDEIPIELITRELILKGYN